MKKSRETRAPQLDQLPTLWISPNPIKLSGECNLGSLSPLNIRRHLNIHHLTQQEATETGVQATDGSPKSAARPKASRTERQTQRATINKDEALLREERGVEAG
jgi:hypothetical protein